MGKVPFGPTVGKETLLLVHGSHDNLVITEATATFELDEDWAADEVTLTFRATCNSGKVGTGENRKSFKGTVFQGADMAQVDSTKKQVVLMINPARPYPLYGSLTSIQCDFRVQVLKCPTSGASQSYCLTLEKPF
ncbi:hypothetical protein BGZ88_006914 [Linnemannia elongata]|nr:hypothetical protein BGZ88_006914 [Linnemannia elongata]